jgi:hypothetical protein
MKPTHKNAAVVATLLCRLLLGALAVRAQTSAAAHPPTLATTNPATTSTAPARHNFVRWEKEIAAYEQADRTNPPPRHGILFIGSSTIVRWKTLARDFPGLPVINRGFGGSQIVDSTHFADRIIFPYEPRMILLRAGGNDIHAGKTPQQVFDEFKDFADTVHNRLPDTRISFISLSPAPARWNERQANQILNDLIRNYITDQPWLKYIEAYDLTITPDGAPREDLFVDDKLHFNEQGYKLFADRIRPYLK